MDIQDQINSMTISTSATIREAMRAIDRGMLGLALVVDATGATFVGLVTDGDLRRALLSGFGLEAPVSEVDRKQPLTASTGINTDELVAIIREHKHIRCVPLLDATRRVVDLAIIDRRVPIPVAEPLMGEKELEYVSECILTGWVSSAGKFVRQFEEMFASFCGSKYAIATSNGTTALHLALLVLDIGPGDEVIVPTLTFIASANSVRHTGARPVFVDSDPYTWNIDPELIEAAITPGTKAIMPVHLYGHPADMDPILRIAKKHNLAVIEDAAEAHGARYKDARVGSIGDLGCFSFYGSKIVTTGEGGMVVTDNAELAKKNTRSARSRYDSRETLLPSCAGLQLPPDQYPGCHRCGSNGEGRSNPRGKSSHRSLVRTGAGGYPRYQPAPTG
jgi:perosamine synthetase